MISMDGEENSTNWNKVNLTKFFFGIKWMASWWSIIKYDCQHPRENRIDYLILVPSYCHLTQVCVPSSFIIDDGRCSQIVLITYGNYIPRCHWYILYINYMLFTTYIINIYRIIYKLWTWLICKYGIVHTNPCYDSMTHTGNTNHSLYTLYG